MRLIVAGALIATTVLALPSQAQGPPGPPPGRPGGPGIRPPQGGPPPGPPPGNPWRPSGGPGARPPGMQPLGARPPGMQPPGARPRPPAPLPPGWGRNRNQWRRYDFDRPPPGQPWYYADHFYRDGRYYRPRRLGPYDRIYRGYNGRYYCRRSDGTTGLIIGGISGGILGGLLSNGDSSPLGALIGAGAGAALGTAIDQGQVICR